MAKIHSQSTASPRRLESDFGNVPAEVLGCGNADFVARDTVLAIVDQRGSEMGRGLTVADDDHLLAQQRCLYGSNRQLLAAVAGGTDGDDPVVPAASVVVRNSLRFILERPLLMSGLLGLSQKAL